MVANPVSDMLTRIRNAKAVNKETVVVPLSKFRLSLAKALKKQGVLVSVKKKERILVLGLGKFNTIKAVSKLGQRIYQKSKELNWKPYGFNIVSTSKGLMTGRDAKKNGLGGELICEIT